MSEHGAALKDSRSERALWMTGFRRRPVGQARRVAIDWARLRELADGQHDLLTRRQCLAAGMTAEAVDWRVSSRRWTRLYDGVYLTKPGRNDWSSTALAALLSASSGSTAADAPATASC